MSNKTSDKNVATEEDLEVLNEVLLHNRETEQVRIAIEHILAEREQKDKRIQELEEENKRKDMFVEMAKEVIENSILKQTIIDKVKENKQILDRTNDGNLRERLYIENDILQELLEGEKH